MDRLVRLLPSALAAALLLWASSALAQGAPWPDFPLDPQRTGDEHTIARGPGHYVSLAKIAFAWLLVAAWAGTTDWISRDCRRLRIDHRVWNSVAFFTFLAVFILMLLIPLFPIGLTLLLMAYLGPLGAYVYTRNAQVDPSERVLTPDHLRHLLARKAQKVGVKIDPEKRASHEHGAPVELSAQGGATPRDDNVNLLTARQSPGFVVAKELLAEAADRRAEVVMFDYTSEVVETRYQIDGVWHGGQPRDRQSGDLMLAVMKVLANLDADQRVKKQAGVFGARYNGTAYTCRLLSQGTDKGERVVVKLEAPAAGLRTLIDLGMREKVRESFLQVLGAPSGFLLLSATPSGGLSTTLRVALDEADRLTRNFVALEAETQREIDIENIEVHPYDAAAGQTPAAILPAIIRKYPDVIVVPDLADLETCKLLCDQAKADRMVISTLRAKDACEALARVLMLKVPVRQLAGVVSGVLNQRLVRRLCTQCRVAYQPSAETLAKLGLPADRVPALYREPNAEESAAQPCVVCAGLGYLGRVALFEWLPVDDRVRTELLKPLKLENLRKAAREAGCRPLQEEGILLAARGVTSISELTRALKQ